MGPNTHQYRPLSTATRLRNAMAATLMVRDCADHCSIVVSRPAYGLFKTAAGAWRAGRDGQRLRLGDLWDARKSR